MSFARSSRAGLTIARLGKVLRAYNTKFGPQRSKIRKGDTIWRQYTLNFFFLLCKYVTRVYMTLNQGLSA